MDWPWIAASRLAEISSLMLCAFFFTQGNYFYKKNSKKKGAPGRSKKYSKIGFDFLVAKKNGLLLLID
jgi:hypothetical protein